MVQPNYSLLVMTLLDDLHRSTTIIVTVILEMSKYISLKMKS